MKKKVKYLETLLFYDVPQLFVVEDNVNTNYICVLIESTESVFKSFCVPISKSRLELIKMGEFDVSNAFKEVEIPEYYVVEVQNENDELELLRIELSMIRQEWYPESNLYISPDAHSTNDILSESIEKHRGIIHLSLNPPEAISEPKIGTMRLGNALKYFELLTKNAYNSVIRKRLNQRIMEGYETEVFAFSPGSFKVHIQSKYTADMFGFSSIAFSMEKIDEILGNINDLNNTVELMKKNKGHLISAFIKFFDFMIKNETSISYTWVTPELESPKSKFISKLNAELLYKELTKIEEISSEEIIFTGKVTKADSVKGTWSIENLEDNKVYNGLLSDKSNISLSGIIIDKVTYKFICEEILEDVLSSGKEKHKLLLKAFSPI